MKRKIDYSGYSQSDLEEAWLSVDDHQHPERAIEIYIRLQNFEKEQVESKQESKNNWFLKAIGALFKYQYKTSCFDVTLSDSLLEESNAQMKAKRVLALIESGKHSQVIKNK
ncbi:hypothetical protein [Pseudoalteromonas luteoviolacea]|uniref:hypothetical protein n=1 Tax=Pseudoalteromonas luteoviolacea TaxID=43657 RepID=UPI0011503BC9|nr:hypothetical protein [Pseudoalteromonas luteoviolacea]TQF67593.1 hypothetical protein FLM44_20640 [Pseudoalteromonas luteoviolacea]